VLYIPRYKKSENIYQLGFFKEKEEMPLLVVTPMPQSADIFRERIQKESSSDNFDVITISQFLKKELKSYLGKDIERKSKLLLYFSTVWKKFFPEEPYEVFSRSFNLLTELRSFTLEEDLFMTILEEYDPVIQKSVIIFNQLMKQVEYLDEHAAYHELSECLRSIPTDEYKSDFRNIIFWGFNFLTSQQVDFVKSLAIRENVYIPVPDEVYHLKTKSDWISWLQDVKSEDYLVGECQESDKKLNVVQFSKNYLGKSLKTYLEKNEISSAQFFLGLKRTSVHEIFEVPVEGVGFKGSADIFEEDIQELQKIIERNLLKDELLVEYEQLKYFLEDELKKEIVSKNKRFKRIKVISLFLRTINEWFELSSDNETVDLRDLKVLFEILRLDTPRAGQVPMLESESMGNIYDLKGLEFYNDDIKNIFCVSSNYSKIRGSESNFSEKVEVYLAAIGPLRRADLEFQFTRSRLRELLVKKNSILFIEHGLTKEDQSWESVLEGIEGMPLENRVLEKSGGGENILDISILKNEKITKVSATRLQTYLDCPRKYYFGYIEKMFPNVYFKSQLQPNELGSLEHEIIEDYFKKEKDWNESFHRTLCKKNLDSYIEKREMEIDEVNYDNYYIELRNFSGNGIRFVLGFKSIFNEHKYKFEEKIKNESNGVKSTGSIDLLVQNNDSVFILDFKRSAGGIASADQVKNFEKIQTWFYLKNSIKKDLKNITIGYICLTDLKSSILFTGSADVLNAIKNSEDMSNVRVELIEDLDERIESYKSFESELIEKIEKENQFKANPRESIVCQYCELRAVCFRKERGEDVPS
jgi:CRISPR/Cas system-associated exonuclease Cas4 (RecB family)